MQSIIISWDPDTGAEPSNCFDSFEGRVFRVSRFSGDDIQFIWCEMLDRPDGYVITGWEHDPKTGLGGDRITLRLDDVRRMEYL